MSRIAFAAGYFLCVMPLVMTGCGPTSSITAARTMSATASSHKASVPSFLRLVIAGDSIGAGNITGSDPWSNLQLPSGYEIKNHSVSGSYLGQHAASFGYEPAELADYTNQYGSGNTWLIIQAGTNDLSQGAPSGALYQDNIVKMVNDAHSVGFRVMVATILPRNNRVFSWSSDNEQQRLAYNDLVRANSGGADAIADVAAESTIGSSAATYDSSLFADGLHPTQNAYDNYIEPVYSRALMAAGSGEDSAPAPTATPVATPEPTPQPTPVATPEPTPQPVSQPTPSESQGSSLGIYQSSNSSLTASVGQSSVTVNIHLNASPLESPFYLACLSLVNSGGRYVDQSGACFNPPQRSDLARGDESFQVDLALPSNLQPDQYTVVFSYMQWTGGGWQRAALSMGSNVTKSPEMGNIDPNQYAVAALKVGGQASPPTPVPTPVATPQPVSTIPVDASGLVIYPSSPQAISASGGQFSVAVNIRYNAQPLNSPFYSMCLSLVGADGRYVESSGACFDPVQRSDVARGAQSLDVHYQLPANLNSGSYAIVLSYMQWTGNGWQRAAMTMGDGVVRSPEIGLADPNQYLIGSLRYLR